MLLTAALSFVLPYAFCIQAEAVVQAPRPNIIWIMADDMGFSDLGCYGGEIETPNLDQLAAGGLRYTQFYNSGRCCPTRASLLTGLYPHQAGIGHMTSESIDQSQDKGYKGYRGALSPASATVAEVLSVAGYRTYMSGKWHVGTFPEAWPLKRGFQRFSGLIRGASNYFRPAPDKLLMLETTPLKPDDDFYITDAFTEWAIEYIEDAEGFDDQPFFLYLAYTAPHWPLHALKQDVDKYRGKYLMGWDALRHSRLARMQSLGIVNPSWELSDRDCREWNSLPEDKRKEMDLRMALYAAQVDRMDQGIGRLLQSLRRMGELENTIIFFFADNGGCAEGGDLGAGPKRQLETKEGYYLSYGRGWANASNTPFRRFKHWVHEGGIASPLIVHWPAGISGQGELRHDPIHLIDLFPTAMELSGADYPVERDGYSIPSLEGISIHSTFSGDRLPNRSLYWEHEGNSAVRKGDLKLVARHGGDWELYNLEKDRTETQNLARKFPQLVVDLASDYEAWAKRVGVLPYPPRRRPGYFPPNRVYPDTWQDVERAERD